MIEGLLAVAKAEAERNAVNHPTHYTSHPSGVECITITEHMTFNAGNAVKYLWRAGLKVVLGPTGFGPDALLPMKTLEKHIEDLKKARWYIDREVTRLEKQLPKPEFSIRDQSVPRANHDPCHIKFT